MLEDLLVCTNSQDLAGSKRKPQKVVAWTSVAIIEIPRRITKLTGFSSSNLYLSNRFPNAQRRYQFFGRIGVGVKASMSSFFRCLDFFSFSLVPLFAGFSVQILLWLAFWLLWPFVHGRLISFLSIVIWLGFYYL